MTTPPITINGHSYAAGSLDNYGWVQNFPAIANDIGAVGNDVQTQYEAVLSAVAGIGAWHGYTSKAALDADLAPGDGAIGVVVGDPTPGYDGTYFKVGATGTGSWSQRSQFSLADLNTRMTANENATTANAASITTLQQEFERGVGRFSAWGDPFFRRCTLGDSVAGRVRWFNPSNATLVTNANSAYGGKLLQANGGLTAGPRIFLKNRPDLVAGGKFSASILAFGNGTDTGRVYCRPYDATGVATASQVSGDSGTLATTGVALRVGTLTIPANTDYIDIYWQRTAGSGDMQGTGIIAMAVEVANLPTAPVIGDAPYYEEAIANLRDAFEASIGALSGWPDPFFRRIPLSPGTYGNPAKSRYFNPGNAAWATNANNPYLGNVLRGTGAAGQLFGVTVWLSDVGLAPGDNFTAASMLLGASGSTGLLWRPRDDSLSYTGAQVSGNTVTLSASAPQRSIAAGTIPASTTNIIVYWTIPAAAPDVCAFWCGKYTAATIPTVPPYGEQPFILAAIAKHEADIGALGGGSLDMLSPPTIFGVVGKEVNVYRDSLIADDPDAYEWTDTSAFGTQYNECWRYVPGATTAGSLVMAAYTKRSGSQLGSTSSMAISVAAAAAKSGAAPQIVHIGDSTWAGGTPTQTLLDLCAAESGTPFAPVLVGTQGSGSNKHEAVSGKDVTWFYSDPSSPFVFSSTFNFSQYATANGFGTIDIVAINLGINGVIACASDADAQTLATADMAKLETMIASMQAHNAAIKVGLCVTIPPSKDQDAFGANYGTSLQRWRHKRNRFIWCKTLIAQFAGRTGSNIWVVPYGMNLDTRNNMQRAAAAAPNGRATYQFLVSGITTQPAAGAIYTHNGSTFYVSLVTLVDETGGGSYGGVIEAVRTAGTRDPLGAGGTLTKSSGTGDASVTFRGWGFKGSVQRQSNGVHPGYTGYQQGGDQLYYWLKNVA